MCTNGRFIYNRFSRQNVFVRCGKCPACQQEKAMARTNRIRSHQLPGTICLFVTLTYTNDFVPYVLRSDLLSPDYELNVYRNCSGRYVYGSKKGLRFKKEYGVTCVDKQFVPFDFRSDSSTYKLKALKGLSSDKIGVCYYNDLQDFYKRLRQNYERDYREKMSFDYWSVAEYGGYSYRPHFHLLLFIRSADEAKVRASILKSWPFADSRRTAKFIEVARDAASYVSSYVNGSNSVTSCFASSPFRQKHSQSKNLGFCLECYSLPALLEKLDRNDIHVYLQQKFDGSSCVTSMLIPQYVINRYFPKFKGMRWLDGLSLRSVLVDPAAISDYFGTYQREIRINIFGSREIVILSDVDKGLANPCYTFSPTEVRNIYVRLYNAQKRFISEIGLTAYDFADYFIKAWSLYQSTLIKDSLTNIEVIDDYADFYFNSNDLIHGVVHSPTLDGVSMVSDPNTFRDVVNRTRNFEHIFMLKDKTRKVVNYSMSNLSYDV